MPRHQQDHGRDRHVQARERGHLREGVVRLRVREQVGSLGHVPRLGVLDHRVRQPAELRRGGVERTQGGDQVVGRDPQDPHPQHRADEVQAVAEPVAEHQGRDERDRDQRRERLVDDQQDVGGDVLPEQVVQQHRWGVTEEQPPVPGQEHAVARTVEDVPALEVVVAEVHEVVGRQRGSPSCPAAGRSTAAATRWAWRGDPGGCARHEPPRPRARAPRRARPTAGRGSTGWLPVGRAEGCPRARTGAG